METSHGHETFSTAGQAIDSGDLTVNEFYWTVGTFGLNQKYNSAVAWSNGEISDHEFAREIAKTGGDLLLAAVGLRGTTIGSKKIPKLKQTPKALAEEIKNGTKNLDQLARELLDDESGSLTVPSGWGNFGRGKKPDPSLKRIHPDSTYAADPKAKASLAYWRGRPTNEIVESLKLGGAEPLRTKPDGRMLNGNTRTKVLEERGYDIDSLPRQVEVPNPFLDDPFFGLD